MSMGKTDFSELKVFTKQFNQFSEDMENIFYEEAAQALAAKLLGLVIPRTPIGDYSEDLIDPHKEGGTLRRGWTGGKDVDWNDYADTLTVKRVGGAYEVEVANPVDYAKFVELGHKQQPGRFVPNIGKRLVRDWVEGQFFLKISVEELDGLTPNILSNRLERAIKGAFS